MLVSVNWLKDYVDIDEDVEQLAEKTYNVWLER